MGIDLDTFLTAVYIVVDDLYRERLAAALRHRPGPAPALSDSEVLTLAICAEWGPWDSERGLWRFARERLGHLFVTQSQWDELLAAVGGWPESTSELAAAEASFAGLAGRGASSQGFRVDPGVRRAVEGYAMRLATNHYRAHGWDVENVSTREPYDLRCSKAGRSESRIEVKGSTSGGAKVLLTPNEVQHARSQYPHVALFVVAGIEVRRGAGGELELSGGQVTRYEPWAIDEGVLEPIGYAYAPSRDSPG